MERFKNILLVDNIRVGSQVTLQRAEALARNNKAQLTVLKVLGDVPRDMKTIFGSKRAVEIREEAVRNCENQLDELIAHVKGEGEFVSTKVLVGTPFLEIIREVFRNEHDLVMITAEGKESGFTDMLFGRTTMHLMRKCPCPVWVIKPAPPVQYNRILAAVDPDPSDEEKSALNEKILELSSSLTRTEKSKIHVVHIWGDPDEIRLWSHNLSNVGDDFARESFDVHRGRLDELLKKHVPNIPRSQVHLLQGDPGRVINKLSKDIEVDLIVMGTVCRTGVDGYLIGNTAEKVLQKADCSVLAVKPDGFISPVSLN